mmetsp:Transcript_9539/g.12404  ORF Transcript_9539/g.12404 Transcript_9539/m.12404 type:complete len:226 (-) Transcript_9539:377-1054(-)
MFRFLISSLGSVFRRPRIETSSMILCLRSASLMSLDTLNSARLLLVLLLSAFLDSCSGFLVLSFRTRLVSTVFVLSHLSRPVRALSTTSSSLSSSSDSDDDAQSSLSISSRDFFGAFFLPSSESSLSLSSSLSSSLEESLSESDPVDESLSEASLLSELPLPPSFSSSGFSRYAFISVSNLRLCFLKFSFMRFKALPFALFIFFWASLSLRVVRSRSSSSASKRM